MASKGIWQAKIEKSKDYTIVQHEGTYVEFKNLNSNIVAFVDEECLLEDTADPIKTLRETKWIIIDQIVWDSLLWQYRKDSKKDTFGDSEFFKKIQPHIIKQYNGSKISVKGSDIKDISAGNTYLLIPYSIYPEKRYIQQSIRLVYLKEPYVRYVYIAPPKMQEADIPLGYDSKLHLYGMYANLHLSTHILPDFRRKGKTSFDKVSCKINGVVFFMNQSNEEVTVDNFETVLEAGENNYNSYKDLKIYIDPNWRNSEGTHAKDHQPQKYFIKIFASEIVTSTALNFSNPLGQNDNIKNLFNPIIYNTNTDFQTWYRFDKEDESWIALDMQPHIEVRWDTMEMIFSKIEIEKNNQIQYIGDIPYSNKENDPCGYSSITIKEEFNPNDKKELDEKLAKQDKKLADKKLTKQEVEANKTKINSDFENRKRLPLVLFDEKRSTIDNTSKIFDITTGENKKSVSIKIGGLTNKNVYCQGLLLDETTNQKHNDKKNVFQIERVVFSALRLSNGDYQRENDNTHKKQLKDSEIDTTKENKTDTDVIKNHDNSKIKEVKDVLNWHENEDYTFIGEDELKLNLGYHYIKHLTTFNNEIDPNVIGNLFEEAWLFNYFFLNYSKQKQIYYLPVSTCRYPNQIVKINVLPDIKWTLLFKFNFKKEDWKKFEETYDYEVNAYFLHSSETTQTTSPNGTTTTSHSSTAAGVSIRRTTTVEEIQPKGGIKRLIELLKRVEVSLTAEWTDESSKKQSKDVIEGFYKPIYGFFKKLTDISKMISAITEGESNDEDKNKKKLLDDELKKMAGKKDAKEVVGGIYDILTAKSVETELIYPSIGLGLSWYYGDAYKKDNPIYTGKKALEYNLQVEAKPIVGIQTTLNFLEMLAKKHPIAYIIVKVVQVAAYLTDGKINVSLVISGTLNFEGNGRYNTLSGFSSSSAKKEKLADLTGEVSATLEGELSVKFSTYQIITEFNASGTFKLGVKTKIIPGAHIATDTNGMFYETDLDFEGFTFYLKAEGKAEFLFFGMKIFEWEDSYEPEPWNVGKAYIASEKKYLIQ